MNLNLNEKELKACINGLEWELDQCDCGRPSDVQWVAEYEALIRKLRAHIKEQGDTEDSSGQQLALSAPDIRGFGQARKYPYYE